MLALGLFALIEALTLLARFGFDLQATRDTASLLSPLTGGVRIHHGYLGVLALVLGGALGAGHPGLRCWLMAIGLALVASDLFHHAVVLRIITGDSGFHLTYPDPGAAND